MSQVIDKDDEIDLLQLVLPIRRNLRRIILCAFAITCSFAIYAYTIANDEYTAQARFELSDPGNSSIFNNPLFEGVGALAGAALGTPGGEDAKLEDRIISRPFVEEIYTEAGFGDDPLFNKYIAAPSRLSMLIAFFMGEPERITPSPDDLYISAMAGFEERMQLEVGKNGIIALSIRHKDPRRAALIANVIVSQVLKDILARAREKNRQRLDHFAIELLRARSDLDSAGTAVTDYALKNNLQSAEILARTSSQLVQLRTSIQETDHVISVVQDLIGVDPQSFSGREFDLTLENPLPIALRRAFGWSAADSSAWELPPDAVLRAAIISLRDQKEQLISNLVSLEDKARESGDAALELAGLERELEVQNLMYQSIITQFEYQSQISSFEQPSGLIIESALPPRNPSAPNKRLILILGIFLGTGIGMSAVVIGAYIRGSVHGKAQLERVFDASWSAHLTNQKLPHIATPPKSRAGENAFQNIVLNMTPGASCVAIVSSQAGAWPLRFATGLVYAHMSLGKKATILDLSEVNYISKQKVTDSPFDDLMILNANTGFDLYRPKNTDFMNDIRSVDRFISTLSEKYETVFVVCPDVCDASAVATVVVEKSDEIFILIHDQYLPRTAVDAMQSAIFNTAKAKRKLFLC